MEDLEIRFAGAAGQGIVLAARILSQTLSRDGREVAQSQSYEPTSRGETSRSDVVIGNGAVDYPLATRLDVLVLLDEVGLGASSVPIKRGGMVLAESRGYTAVDGLVVALLVASALSSAIFYGWIRGALGMRARG